MKGGKSDFSEEVVLSIMEEDELVTAHTRQPSRMLHIFAEPIKIETRCEINLAHEDQKSRCRSEARWEIPLSGTHLTFKICEYHKNAIENPDCFKNWAYPDWVYDFLGAEKP